MSSGPGATGGRSARAFTRLERDNCPPLQYLHFKTLRATPRQHNGSKSHGMACSVFSFIAHTCVYYCKDRSARHDVCKAREAGMLHVDTWKQIRCFHSDDSGIPGDVQSFTFQTSERPRRDTDRDSSRAAAHFPFIVERARGASVKCEVTTENYIRHPSGEDGISI